MLDIAWAAGVYEGEGTVRSRHKRTIEMSVAQKDVWLLERLRDLFGGTIYQSKSQNSRGTKYTIAFWNLYGTRARGFLMTIYSFLSPRRRDKIREVLLASAS
jgi:hypothetical protein